MEEESTSKAEEEGSDCRSSSDCQQTRGSPSHLPIILSISDYFNIDLLCLSDYELEVVLGVDNLGPIDEVKEDLLTVLDNHREKMAKRANQEGGDELNTTSNLALFLNGCIFEDYTNTSCLISLASALAQTGEGKTCHWKRKFEQKWSWFERKYDEWIALQENIKSTINEVDDRLQTIEQIEGEDEQFGYKNKRGGGASKTFLYMSSLSLLLHRLQASDLSRPVLEADAISRLSHLQLSAMRWAEWQNERLF
uniref:Uncharacterized protein n=1 Tax=Palpitomonas bilix TaxID=652834 RepID=A0A7S3D7Q4_9EUKA|mmetsp:Transcript_23565/g.59439  ORF Transcript_23565/g.59439 Transcript_23565/m.59439 type:complete len:252 (+) Transcript_23565:1080-1835(+)